MYRLVLRSLRFYWRTHLGVCTGALLASAVLTGALLVGDSVDYSLRTFAMQRLGGIHFALNMRSEYFEDDLGRALREKIDSHVAPALHLRGMAIFDGATAEERVQINQVEVFGVDANFWNFADGSAPDLGANETAINSKLAAALGVKQNDYISLRVAKPSLMARDAPLSWRSDERSRRRRYKVKKILADTELGRFSLSPSQVPPYNAFVNRSLLQEQVDLGGRVNMMLVGEGVSSEELNLALKASWKPEHLGLEVRVHDSGVVQLETDRVFLDKETARAASTIPEGRGTLTYLINSISKGDASTPYSFAVAGVAPDGMGDDEIVINRWVADAIGAGVGDRITIAYVELLASNDFKDESREFTVHSIREMADLDAERELMPVFPGLSDVESCSEWDVGMPMDDEILQDEANEAYWDAYRQTPKCFLTLAAGQAMWGNRFGDLTAVRYAGGTEKAEALRAAIRNEMDPALAGLFFLPVRAQAFDAVSGAMDFGGLFLGMSFFLIVAALMLTGMLFVFGVQQRASEMGALLALGFRPGSVRLLLLSEGSIIALVGTVAGAGLGALYTRALIYGLGTYWQGAVANSTVLYHAEITTMVMGGAISLICAVSAMAIAMWRQSKHSARELLHMDFTQDQSTPGKERSGTLGFRLSAAGVAVSLVIVLYALMGYAVDVMIPFFAAGSLLLLSGLGLCRYALIRLNSGGASRDLTLGRLALQNVARRQGRSLAVVALLACGCFMVFAVSAMQEDLYAHAHDRSSGTGGFALVADSTFPLLEDPLKAIDDPDVSGTAIKVRDGDDASCLNLNQAQTPRMLGVNVAELAKDGAFSSDGDESIWELLNLDLPDGAIPALVGDANTAMWTLKKKTGIEKGDVLLYRDESGDEVKVKLVGALPMRLSVFQGTILISDEAFTRIYPSEAGHRLFLIDAPEEKAPAVAAKLGKAFDRFGLDAVPAVERLLEFYAVETTYLAMFLVLGGLGLAIGSVGMGVVVLRNLLERRGEMAMLRALGFKARPIYQVLFTEYGFLLAAGLGIGGIAAAVSIIPAFLATNSQVAIAVQLQLAALVLLTCATCMTAAILTGFRKNDAAALRSE